MVDGIRLHALRGRPGFVRRIAEEGVDDFLERPGELDTAGDSPARGAARPAVLDRYLRVSVISSYADHG